MNYNKLHRIIITEIEESIKINPTEVNVYKIFNEINSNFFGENPLPMCNIKMITDKRYLGYFKCYSDANGNGMTNPTIMINKMYQLTIKELESIVAHEMIHYYLAYYGVDKNCRHIDEFHRIASEMNKQLGLSITDTVDVTNTQYGNMGNKQSMSTELLGYMNSYLQSLTQYLPKISEECKGKSGNVLNVYRSFYYFTQNIIAALKRCIAKRSINESFADSAKMIGNNLTNNVTNSFTDNVKSTISNGIQSLIPIRALNGITNGSGRNEYYNSNANGNNNNNNNTSNEKLIYLLYNYYPKLRKQYENISQMNPSQTIANEIKILDDLKTRIEAETKNAQGNNP